MQLPCALRAALWGLALLLLPAVQAQSIRFNEVFADNKTNSFVDGSISDWVELVNTSGSSISLAGYSLTDSASTPRKWIFPEGVSIQANAYLVVLLDSTRSPSAAAAPILNAGFGVKASGDRIELYGPGAVPPLVDSVRFGPQAANYTIGRIPTVSGNFELNVPTPGTANAQQSLGSQATLRINEWMASPSSGSDWFELYNPDALPVQLTGLHFRDNGNVPSPVAPLSYIGSGLNGFLQMIADNSTNDNEVDFGLSANGDSIG
ncbi:MAG TPA: lamin tail domain-containing protein, partial [Candidatus Kapabacteria bacterium]|nr:lamin tail domain-containing protein [Candidatus Kapabacteria bacterium]